MTDPRLRRHPLGFLEVVDRPTPVELSDYYAKQYYQTERSGYRHSYSALERSVIEQRVAHRSEHAHGLRGDRSPARLLDVGCGEGFVLAGLKAQGWEVEGIDFSGAGIESFHPELLDCVETGDVFALLQRRVALGRQYQMVWLGNVLEHVLDPVGLMQSLARVVCPGGLLVVTVPNDGSPFQESLFADGHIQERFWISPPDHLPYFTADSLRAIAEATGWKCRDILADFPIDWYLAHPSSNCVRDRAQGSAAHQARLRLEHTIGLRGPESANALYRSLAAVGLGRNITAFLSPNDPEA